MVVENAQKMLKSEVSSHTTAEALEEIWILCHCLLLVHVTKTKKLARNNALLLCAV